MRSREEVRHLKELQKLSFTVPVDWTNGKGERFLFENGQMTAYTDTRVINHEDDRLKNLAEEPFIDD